MQHVVESNRTTVFPEGEAYAFQYQLDLGWRQSVIIVKSLNCRLHRFQFAFPPHSRFPQSQSCQAVTSSHFTRRTEARCVQKSMWRYAIRHHRSRTSGTGEDFCQGLEKGRLKALDAY